MTMTSIDRREKFFDALNAFLVEEGYVRKKNSFIKKEGKNTFEIDFNIWPNFSQVEPKYRGYLSEVEATRKKALGLLYSKRFSIGRNRFQMSGRSIEESILDTHTSALVDSSVQKEINLYVKKIKPFFEKGKDVVYLDSYLNTNPGTVLDISMNSVDSSFLAVIVAYLSKRRNINMVISVCRSIIAKDGKDRLAEFDALANYVTDNIEV